MSFARKKDGNSKMKISDYIVKQLRALGTRYVFGLQGSGTAVQLFDSLAREEGIDYVCTLHEQAAGMAADAYANISRGLGACVVDSGPATTNLLTAVTGSFYESNPVLYIVGQTASEPISRELGLRHYGFHECNARDIFRPVTKYVTQIEHADDICYEFEKSVYLAREGRPGPVLMAIPDNITWLNIEPDKLRHFTPEIKDKNNYNKEAEECLHLLKASKRPIILAGNGVRCAGAEKELLTIAGLLDCPIALTWAVRDILPSDDPRNIGSFGAHGSRAGNFAVQNADFILSVGARLNASEIGNKPEDFARGACLITVDIDPAEIEKYSSFGIPVRRAIQADVGAFLCAVLKKLDNKSDRLDIQSWRSRINFWKTKYPLFLPEYYKEPRVNPYVFVEALSHALKENEIVVTDASTSKNYVFQAFQIKQGQRLASWLNFGSLGYGLPGAIGACFARPGNRVIAVMGDGALQFNIQELATAAYHRLNLKIFVFHNEGFSCITHQQRRYLEGRFSGADREHGLPLPDSCAIVRAYGIPVIVIGSNSEMEKGIQETLSVEGPAYCAIHIPIDHWTVPCRVGNDPIEDLTPKLPREEFYEQMIIPPLEQEEYK